MAASALSVYQLAWAGSAVRWGDRRRCEWVRAGEVSKEKTEPRKVMPAWFAIASHDISRRYAQGPRSSDLTSKGSSDLSWLSVRRSRPQHG